MKKDLLDIARRARADYAVGKIPFLAGLGDREIEDFKGLIEERQFKKNQLILHEEDTANYFYFVFSGKVKIIQLSAEGKEKILAIHKRGDFFGEMAILDGGTAPATVVAIENTRIGQISREVFHRQVLSNNNALRGLIALLCGRLRNAWSMAKVMSFADAEHRVRAVLKYMAEQFGVTGPEGIRIEMKLTHADIGNFASLTRETVSRMISRLEQAKEIEIIDHKFILLKPAFQKKSDSV
ncbi:MAG: Crp/Fnr family transcriptional regulator [Deltaproteobacteria bacterium HGW-Deltaproteobacteria-12]|jgi:CRP/FNR family transcriptional regulator|nr:MAG: Crp/Fnr family transcriptional regulator [Deltaproteobacteria bacterium HGW-Deltaproteobacteria-12]